MRGILLPTLKYRAVDNDGEALVGGKLYSYQSGTVNTPLATYSDADLQAANANPIILDARGEAAVHLGPGLYRFEIYDANDVLIDMIDEVVGNDSTIVTDPGAGVDQEIARGALSVPDGVDAPLGQTTPAEATVTDLTVTSSTSKQRVVNMPAVGQTFSANLQSDGATRDVAGRWGMGLAFDTINGGVKLRAVSPGGTVKDYAPRFTAGADFTAHVNTGNTTLNTVLSRTILGNTLGANGGFRIRLLLNVTAQGAVQSYIGVHINGVELVRMLTPAGAGTPGIYEYEVFVGNRNDAKVQICYAVPTFLGAAAAVLQGQAVAGAVDTTADMQIDVKIQNGSNTDSVKLDMFEMEIFTTFAM